MTKWFEDVDDWDEIPEATLALAGPQFPVPTVDRGAGAVLKALENGFAVVARDGLGYVRADAEDVVDVAR